MTQFSHEHMAIAEARPAMPNGGMSRKLSTTVATSTNDRDLDRSCRVLPRIEARG